jgi:hypothetical protein
VTKVVDLVPIKQSSIKIEINVLVIVNWLWQDLADSEAQDVLYLDKKVKWALLLNHVVFSNLFLKSDLEVVL